MMTTSTYLAALDALTAAARPLLGSLKERIEVYTSRADAIGYRNAISYVAERLHLADVATPFKPSTPNAVTRHALLDHYGYATSGRSRFARPDDYVYRPHASTDGHPAYQLAECETVLSGPNAVLQTLAYVAGVAHNDVPEARHADMGSNWTPAHQAVLAQAIADHDDLYTHGATMYEHH